LCARTLPAVHASLKEAAAIVRGGGLVVYPTDTVYGLGCDPMNEEAVDRLFKAKGRDTKPLPVLCASAADAGRLVKLNPTSLGLAASHWPGALTMVLPLKKAVPRRLNRGGDYLGVRVPGLRFCRDLVGACGGVLTGTSANLSGRPSCRTAEEAGGQLAERVDLILDGGTAGGLESTVVKVVGRGIMILRQGRVRVERR
jgi:L-threonylcarbamoyladenylate synthase